MGDGRCAAVKLAVQAEGTLAHHLVSAGYFLLGLCLAPSPLHLVINLVFTERSLIWWTFRMGSTIKEENPSP